VIAGVEESVMLTVMTPVDVVVGKAAKVSAPALVVVRVRESLPEVAMYLLVAFPASSRSLIPAVAVTVTGLDFKVLLMDMRKTSVVDADVVVTVPEVGTVNTIGSAEVPAPVPPSALTYAAPVALVTTGRAEAEVVATRPERARAAAAATAISFLDI
jgi:hypothetical protein